MTDIRPQMTIYVSDWDRLRAENEKLREQCESPFMDGYETAKHEYRDRLIAAEEEIERLRAAIAWIEPPFVDDNTPEPELRQRVNYCVADAKRAALQQKVKP